MPFTLLEANILKAKGLTDAQLARLGELGIASKEDFKTVGDGATLRQLMPDLPDAVAAGVLVWAGVAAGAAAGGAGGAQIVVESSDVVNCVHCKTKQPKDYKSGDLCSSCGKQAEPMLTCFWCSSSGPGKFCRQCGAEFVPTSELDLGRLLKQEGIAKEAVPGRLRAMSAAEKETLWGRVRRLRG